ncbi:hypothetical protein KIW84_021364 [Lathyrus oleraceus]|uniref:Uncharacterized protein n=1 Tax=Pisum sativum TaxID=3888 RepID=A0A9D4Y8V6_PEA|nr:hypothetical protein KIW84_021364 [Pisum sativum]
MVAEEVKALSDCISQVKKIIDHYGDSDGLAVPTSSICQMQSLMLLTMGYVTDVLMCNITSAQEISDQVESNCFVDAAVVSANFSIIAGPHLSKLKLKFQQLHNNISTANVPPPVSILETQGAPIIGTQIEAKPGDPSAVAGASILASFSNFNEDLSLISSPANTYQE